MSSPPPSPPGNPDQAAGWQSLSLTERVVLAVLAEDPSHGFAIARQLRPDTDLGRILTVHRPLVYRALDRLVTAGLAEPQQTEPGAAGPKRTVHAITNEGSETVDQWLSQPVEHVRDLRIEFMAKLRLTERRGRSPKQVVIAQQAALEAKLDRLTQPTAEGDVVDSWRRHNAAAVQAFLDELASAD